MVHLTRITVRRSAGQWVATGYSGQDQVAEGKGPSSVEAHCDLLERAATVDPAKS